MAYMREAVNELIRARSFGGRPSIAEMPREEQLLCSSLRINSAVDLSPPEVALLPDIPQSNRSNFQRGTCHATGVKGFHYAIVPWKVVSMTWNRRLPPDHENLEIFFKAIPFRNNRRSDLGTDEKKNQIFQDSVIDIENRINENS